MLAIDRSTPSGEIVQRNSSHLWSSIREFLEGGSLDAGVFGYRAVASHNIKRNRRDALRDRRLPNEDTLRSVVV
ncbi:hypothetical protein T02_9613 [Trichinella nativa]|uniref:Uncharacterized protein n=1 Tax=Trichinella nativa TaxID=6335 RepID=A0A0V1KJ85_9BILA|nr:hypothetical protein T02_9613 [Trichinella nativa]